jgi:hypothetical protein
LLLTFFVTYDCAKNDFKKFDLNLGAGWMMIVVETAVEA